MGFPPTLTSKEICDALIVYIMIEILFSAYIFPPLRAFLSRFTWQIKGKFRVLIVEAGEWKHVIYCTWIFTSVCRSSAAVYILWFRDIGSLNKRIPGYDRQDQKRDFIGMVHVYVCLRRELYTRPSATLWGATPTFFVIPASFVRAPSRQRKLNESSLFNFIDYLLCSFTLFFFFPLRTLHYFVWAHRHHREGT